MHTTDETIEVRSGEHFDMQKVAQYVHIHIPDIHEGQISVRQFPSGASNLTYLLQIGSWQGVLRRPPFGPIPPRAHDMERESQLLSKLHPLFPLAPRPYLFCNDPQVMDVPFYIMERRTGIVLDTTFPPDVQPNPALCQQLSQTVVETLAQIHAIDWQGNGLAILGHPAGFLERQVKAWIERYKRAETDTLPEAEPLLRWLIEHIPTSPAPTVIHNDFKLNNILLAPANITQVEAVLDWEMATIGDPLFDLAVSLSYWVQADDPAELRTILPSVTTQSGFMSREQFMEAYAQRSGRDLASMHFYMTLAYFKLAVIIQQIYVRWQRGQTQDERFAHFDVHVHNIIKYAAHLAEKEKQ